MLKVLLHWNFLCFPNIVYEGRTHHIATKLDIPNPKIICVILQTYL